MDKMNLDDIAKRVDQEFIVLQTKIDQAKGGKTFKEGWLEKILAPLDLAPLGGPTITVAGKNEGLIKRAREEILKTYGSIENAEKHLAEEKKKSISLKTVELLTSDERALLKESEKRAVLEDVALYTKEQLNAKLEHELEIMRIQGSTEKEILSYKIQQMEAIDKLNLGTKNQLELTKTRYEYEQAIVKEIYEQANAIEQTLAGSIKNIMSGTAGLGSIFTDLNKTIAESYRTTVSDELAKGLMSTGIGTAFGESMISLQGGIKKAHQTVYEWIRRGHIDGMKDAISGGKSPTASYTGIGGFPRIEGAFGGGMVGNLVSAGTDIGSAMSTSNLYGVSGGKTGPATRQQVRNQKIGMGVQSAIVGYSAYQSAKQGGISTGQSIGAGILGAGGSLMAGMGMAALGTAAAMGPVGWAIAGAMIVGSILLGSLGGKKGSQTSVETRTSENKISSKIDVSNRNLEIINRNLIGMRQDIRSYILPQSAYFSTKDSLEAEFSLSSKRGII